VLEEREALAGLGPVDQEPDADTAKEDLVAVCSPDDFHSCRSGLHPDSFPLLFRRALRGPA
jgi:hypothetical protein